MNLFGATGAQTIGLIFGMAALPFLILSWFRSRFHPDTYMVLVSIGTFLYLPGVVILFIFDAEHQDWASATIDLLCGAFVLWWFWRNWKRWNNRKKFKKALGSKSRALIDKMLRNLRQTQPEGTH
jgi:threonine/homoserine/homoserine lactone efflux protein